MMINDEELKAKIGKMKYPKQRFYQVLKVCESQVNRECDQNYGGCGFK
jgi:hypothetical protein